MGWRIAVVDDLALDREQLARDISRFGAWSEPVVCDCYSSAESLLDVYQPNLYDIVFMDIRMEGMDGIEGARRLRAMDRRLVIIFLTSSVEFALDAYPIHPFDYLVKPYNRERLERVLGDCINAALSAEPRLQIRMPRTAVEVPFANVVSVVSMGHAVEVTVQDQRLRSIMTFAEITAPLMEDPRFLLCNRGVLVNMDYVNKMEESSLVMNDGTVFALRLSNRRELIHRFMQYQISRIKGES